MSKKGAKRGFDPSRRGSRPRAAGHKRKGSGSFLTTFALVVAAGTLALWLIDRPGKVERTGVDTPAAARSTNAG